MLFWLAIFLQTAAFAASEVSTLLQQKDWPGLVLLLKPKGGQNFDSDLILAKAYLQLERRSDAQKLLIQWLEGKHAEQAQKQLDLTSTLFFNQETSNLYFDAVRFVSIRKWAEAKEKLDQAMLREPGNMLLISRLVQVLIQLNQKEAASDLIEKGMELNPNQKELLVLKARLDLDDEEEKEAQRILLSQKAWVFEHEVTTLWYFESLHALKRSSEVLGMQKTILKNNLNWGEIRVWLLKNGLIPKDQVAAVKKQTDELLKDPDRYNQAKETEYRKGQYYWISSKSLEQLKAEYEALQQNKPEEKPAKTANGSSV